MTGTPRIFSLILVTVVSLLHGSAASAKAPQPNFIFILIDDMGWTDLACCGSTFYETPHLDQLAARGMRFTNAYAACPVCSPTRASIMTGKYPARLHLTDWLPGRPDQPSQKLLRPDFRQHLPLEEVTIAEALKPHGYVCASIGKWHLGGESYSPQKQGFDLNIAGTDKGSPTGYFYPYKNQRFSIPALEEGKQGEYLTDRLTEEAVTFIEKNRDRPFFLYLPHYAVHIPLQAKKELIARYQAKARPGETHDNPVYAAMIESVDDSVGRIMKKLGELDLAGRTTVIFTSDNGGLSVKEGPLTPATNNAPLRAGKGYLYEGGIRVPLIIRSPLIRKPGSVCAVPVSSVDFFPTVLALAESKDAAKQPVDGVSLLPLLTQGGELKRDALYWHYPHYSNQGGKPGGAVRAGDYKLIEFYEDGKLELYNLKEDIQEKNNLVSTVPEKTRELHKILVDWRRAVNAQMPTPNPAYEPGK